MDNKYYIWWKINKPRLSLFPAVVFWCVSMIFFMVGLKFSNPIIIIGQDLSNLIAISLTVSNTIIQIIGNEQEQDGLGFALWVGWIGSYLLGIGTNIVGLLSILAIDNIYIEWVIALGLGTMIEVLPERLLVQFLRGGITRKVRAPNDPNHPNVRLLNSHSVRKPKNDLQGFGEFHKEFQRDFQEKNLPGVNSESPLFTYKSNQKKTFK